MPLRVLVTGAAGAIGVPVCERLLAAGDEVRAFDRHPSPVGSEVVVGDVADGEAILESSRGIDATIHLGATPWDAPFPELVAPNVLGVFHVLDAARRQGVGRVVLASSIQVLGGSDGRRITDAPDFRRPQNHYALTKVFAEEMGQMYCRFGLDVIVARVGFMVRDAAEARIMVERRMFDRYLSRADAARFFHAAVHAPFAGCAVLHVVGPGGKHSFDLDTPLRSLGYDPEDAWPAGLPFPLPSSRESA